MPENLHRFLTVFRNDHRLGRYLPQPAEGQTVESIVLELTIALADATEGRAAHPALTTLERMEADR